MLFYIIFIREVTPRIRNLITMLISLACASFESPVAHLKDFVCSGSGGLPGDFQEVVSKLGEFSHQETVRCTTVDFLVNK
jgi:hypothetical protein